MGALGIVLVVGIIAAAFVESLAVHDTTGDADE